MKTTSKMVGTVLLALFANMFWAEGSLVPSLKHLLNTRQMKATKLNGADATGSLARLLKHGKSPLKSLGLSSERRPGALHQVAARQLDTDSPVCNQTTYSDNACTNVVDIDELPIPCTQMPGSDFVSFKTGIVDEQFVFFSFIEAGCTGVGIGLGLGKDWENNCVSFPGEDEYYRVSCEEEPPTLATKNVGKCDVRQYSDEQCSGSYESITVPGGCAEIEEEGQTLYVKIQEIEGMLAFVVYEKEGCTGASEAVMLGQAEGLSKCAQADEDEYLQIRCEGADSAASTLLMSSMLYSLAVGIVWLFNCVA